MTTTDGINYTLTVSNRPIKEGYYGYKFVGDTHWQGDPDNSGNNYYVPIPADDFYDLSYTFNRITLRGSCLVTAKNQSPTITYRYYIYDNDAASWDGVTAITGQNWTACEMTNVNGTYIYSVSNKLLTASTTYGSRIVEKVFATGIDAQENYLWIDAGNASQGCRTYACTADGRYNIVYSFTPSNSNYDVSATQPALSVTQGFYA